MKNITVKKLAELSGVSVRTLHYYDEIGLLRPSIRTDKKYRLYGNNEMLRLQQILFFRELDFALKDIIKILDDPEYNLLESLKQHKSALLSRKKRISTLIKTIDLTINNLKNEIIMKNPEELYIGFPEDKWPSYRNEAIAKYGIEAIERSENELLKLDKQGFENLKNELKQVSNSLFDLIHEKPNADEVQKLIASHYLIIRKFWGTSRWKDNQADAYQGLGELYASENSYLELVNNKNKIPEFAVFLQKAMKYFVDSKLR